jgi:tetratricopeptide (TPR) repeat protein
VLLMREGHLAEAIAEYERALEAEPKHAQAWNNLGVTLDAQGKYERARRCFRKAVAADPRYAEAHFNLGLAYFWRNDHLLATRHFEKAVALEPRRASGPYTKLGAVYLAQGEKERAVEAYQRALEASADDGRPNTEAHQGLARAYLGLGRVDEAVATLRTAVEAFPRDASARAAYGDALKAKGDLDGALAQYEERLKLEPTAEAKLALAGAYARKRVGAKAEPLYAAVMEEEPEHRDARLGLADLYLAMGRYDEAEQLLKQLGKDTAALARLGILHSRRGRPDLAVPELEAVTKKDPAQLEARAELGFLYLRGGDTQRAMRTLGNVVAVDPRHPLGLLYLGHALYQVGRAREAEQSFREATRADPTFGEPHYALGQLLEAAGRLEEAREAYEKAAELQRDHPDAAASARRLSALSP